MVGICQVLKFNENDTQSNVLGIKFREKRMYWVSSYFVKLFFSQKVGLHKLVTERLLLRFYLVRFRVIKMKLVLKFV